MDKKLKKAQYIHVITICHFKIYKIDLFIHQNSAEQATAAI